MKKVNSKKWMKKLSLIGLSVGSVMGFASSGLLNQPTKHNSTNHNGTKTQVKQGLSNKANMSSKQNSAPAPWKTAKYSCPKLLTKNLTYKGQIIHNSYQNIAIQYVESGSMTGFNVMYFTDGDIDTAKSMFYFAGPNVKIITNNKENITAACLTLEDHKDGFSYMAKEDDGYHWVYVNWDSSTNTWRNVSGYNTSFVPSIKVDNYGDVKKDLDAGLVPVMTFLDLNYTLNSQEAYHFSLNFNTGYNYNVALLASNNPGGIVEIQRKDFNKFWSFQNAQAIDLLPVWNGAVVKKDFIITTNSGTRVFEDKYAAFYGSHGYSETTQGDNSVYEQGSVSTNLKDQNVFDTRTYTGAYIDRAGQLQTYHLSSNSAPKILKFQSVQDTVHLGFSLNDDAYLNVTSLANGTDATSLISLADKTKGKIWNFVAPSNGPATLVSTETSYQPEEMGDFRMSITYKNARMNVAWDYSSGSNNLTIYYQESKLD